MEPTVFEKLELFTDLTLNKCEHGCHYDALVAALSVNRDCPSHGRFVGGRHLRVVKDTEEEA